MDSFKGATYTPFEKHEILQMSHRWESLKMSYSFLSALIDANSYTSNSGQ